MSEGGVAVEISRAPYLESARVNRSAVGYKSPQRYFCLGPGPLVRRPCLTDVPSPGTRMVIQVDGSSSGLDIPSHVDIWSLQPE